MRYCAGLGVLLVVGVVGAIKVGVPTIGFGVDVSVGAYAGISGEVRVGALGIGTDASWEIARAGEIGAIGVIGAMTGAGMIGTSVGAGA